MDESIIAAIKAGAVLEYRVNELETDHRDLRAQLASLSKQVGEIPGLINRKFEQQSCKFTEQVKDRWGRVLQLGTLFAAISAVAVSVLKH